jgi:hypothetical protein
MIASRGVGVEDVAMERYGNMDDFNEAVEERRILDERDRKRQERRGTGGSGAFSSPASTSGMRTPGAGEKRYMFTSEEGINSRPGSRAGFRRPGEAGEGISTPGTGVGRLEELKRGNSGTPRIGNSVAPKVGSPIPSVFTPTGLGRTSSYLSSQPSGPLPDQSHPSSSGDPSKPPLSTEQLNKLQARVLRAKLMDDPEAENLEAEYGHERDRSERAGSGAGGLWAGSREGSGLQGQMGREEEVGRDGKRVEVQVLPTLDGRGRLYDVGTGQGEDVVQQNGNRRKKPEKVGTSFRAILAANDKQFETRDRQGNLLRYNADDDTQSLGELVRQERFGAGSGDQKNMDSELASAITRDAKFNVGIAYHSLVPK